jgi:DNA modification methylase
VTVASGDRWTLMLGDCVERATEIETGSVGLSVFSPPFPGMYVYSDSERDMGNSRSVEELVEHFGYLIPELLRVLMPGRSCCVHLTQTIRVKYLDGYSGLRDFRGAVIAAMEQAGFIYYGEVAIDKDPQVKAIRTKDQGLLFKSLANDASRMHMALADYLLQFRKPGENPEPIRAGISERYGNPDGWITAEEWIEWAAPVWYRATEHYPGGIRETDVLNAAVARDAPDERHIAPLQLGVVERAVKLWSNPGDLVFSPFAGIGSEGVGALRADRRFVGIELKPSYFKTAQHNLKVAEGQLSLLGAAS